MKNLAKILFVAAFLNALSWYVLIPLWQYPDEQAHFAQLQDLVELGKKPIGENDTSYEIALSEKILGTQRNGFGNNKFTYHPEYNIEYSQTNIGLFERLISNLPQSSRTRLVKKEATYNPPTYYLLSSLPYRFFYNGDLIDRVYAARITSLVLFILLVYTAHRIGTLLFGQKKLLAITLTSLIAFSPMLVFASTGILPDPLTNLLFTIILYLSLKIIKFGISTSYLLLASITLVIGFLTRQQFLIALPIISVPIIYRSIRNSKDLSKVIVIFLLVAVALYVGSFSISTLGFIRNLGAPEIGFPNLTLLLSSEFVNYSIVTFKLTIAQTLPWYWGVYRWLSLTVDPIYYQIINRILIVAVLGILLRIYLGIKNKETSNLGIYFYFLIFASVFYYLVITLWDYFFFLDHGFSFGLQGRYFFPLILAHFTIILIGVWQVLKLILKKYAVYSLLLLAAMMIIFNNVSLFTVASSYYDVSSVYSFINQASQYKPDVFKGIVIPIIIASAIITQAIFLLKFGKLALRRKQ